MCGMLQSEYPQGGWNGAFCNMFLQAFEEVENLKMAIVALRVKAALSMVTMAATVVIIGVMLTRARAWAIMPITTNFT